MITRQMALAVRNQKLKEMQMQLQNPLPIRVPEKIKKPTEWVVLETYTGSPNGSFIRLNRGDKISDATQARILTAEGCILVPSA